MCWPRPTCAGLCGNHCYCYCRGFLAGDVVHKVARIFAARTMAQQREVRYQCIAGLHRTCAGMYYTVEHGWKDAWQQQGVLALLEAPFKAS
jgi:hypothetical protein